MSTHALDIVALDGLGADVGSALLQRGVAARIHKLDAVALSQEGVLESMDIGKSGVVLSASAAPTPQACFALGEQARACGATYVCAYMDGTVANVGTLLTRGVGPCFRCFWRRELTHSAVSTSAEIELIRTQLLDLGLGYVFAFPEFVVPLLATFSADSIERAAAGGARSLFTKYELSTGQASSSRIAALHGCRCRGQPDKERFVRQLPVEELLQWQV